MRAVTFAETKPLPSYLVAFAVGPFELVDAGNAGEAMRRCAIAVPKGRAADAAYPAKDHARRSLDRLEDYFGIAVPVREARPRRRPRCSRRRDGERRADHVRRAARR